MERVLKWPGSKWNIVKQIEILVPAHKTYVEPYFGSGALFFTKTPSDIELINDLDADVPNLFRCIRENPEKLAKYVMATPYSRFEYEQAYEQANDDPYERARKFLVRCWQGHGFRSNKYRVGWKNDVHGRESMYALRDWCKLPERISNTTERLKYVQIDCSPAIDIIQRFNYEDVFMYIDPPYVLNTRNGKQYKHEMSDTEHEVLINQLLRSKAKVMISGYENDLYNNMLNDWRKETFDSCAEYGSSRKEIIWMNYDLDHQMSLLDYGIG